MKQRGRGYGSAMGGRSRGTMRVSATGVLLLGFLGAGCTTGHPSSTSAWQSASDRALGEVISGLGTARLVVQQEQRNRLQHTYSVEAVTDSIETSGREISSYQVQQPPDDLHRANAAVGDALDEASSLLVDVRVALASPGLTEESARRLVQRIDDLRDQLDQLDKTVEKSPGAVGAG
ncbi:hypothetical protein ACVW00_002036 [Marmoricola sp. URHA0025 HA25]